MNGALFGEKQMGSLIVHVRLIARASMVLASLQRHQSSKQIGPESLPTRGSVTV
jgi:hypothetical protein